MSHMRTNGPFSPECVTNPRFCEANLVIVHYCSSDMWLGRETRGRWTFQGQYVLDAVIDELFDTSGLQVATDVLLVGAPSTSAIGLMYPRAS